MNAVQSNNTAKFIRLVLLSYDTSLNVTKLFIHSNILPIYNNDFADLLESHKHDIYHLWINDTRCCQINCNIIHTYQQKTLNKGQFQKLFILPDKAVSGHFIKQTKVIQYCSCGLAVNSTCTLDKLDISLLHTLVQNCCKISQDEKNWFDTIREIRNNLAHVESVSDFDEGRLQKWWDKLEGSVLGLSSKVPVYKNMVESQINLIKMACFSVNEANRVLDLVKKDNLKLKDVLAEEHLKTRDVILRHQTEKAESLRLTIESVKDEVIKVLDRNKAELTIEIKKLVFEIVMHGVNQYITETRSPLEDSKYKDDDENLIKEADKDTEASKEGIQTEELLSKRCRVEWKLQTPDSWKVSQVENALKGTTQMLENWFQVEFVYIGSLIIVTSVEKQLFKHVDVLSSAIRSFLEYVVNVSDLDTSQPETIHVDLTVLDDDDIFRYNKDLMLTKPKYDLECMDSEQKISSAIISQGNNAITDEKSEKEEIPMTPSFLDRQCDICRIRHVVQLASVMCFDCNDLLCAGCEQIHQIKCLPENHKVIPIEDYIMVNPSVTAIEQTCQIHGINYEFHCVDHISPCCVRCVTYEHKACSKIKPLSHVKQDVKKSFAFIDLLERAADVKNVVQNLFKDASTNEDKVRSEKQRVIAEVEKTRTHIDQHLNEMQYKFLRSISKKEEQERIQITRIVRRLRDLLNSINRIQSNLSRAAKHASEINTYFGIIVWNAEIRQCEEEFSSLMNDIKHFECFELTVTPTLANFQDKVNQFSSVVTKYTKPDVIPLQKERQGQVIRDSACNLDIKLTKVISFALPKGKNGIDICGCCILESGFMILTDYNNCRLVLVDGKGKFQKEIQIALHPFDVTIVDYDTIAVTSSWNKKLQIFHLEKEKVVKTVYKGESCYGLSYMNGKFFVGVENDTTKVIDVDGTVLSAVSRVGYANYSCVANDNLYYTASDIDAVFCCDMTGKVKWKYECEMSDYPRGITVDDQGIVFVSCGVGNKVICINKNGQESKAVLAEEDEIDNPRAISYSKQLNCLLVCNSLDGKCFLYKIN